MHLVSYNSFDVCVKIRDGLPTVPQFCSIHWVEGDFWPQVTVHGHVTFCQGWPATLTLVPQLMFAGDSAKDPDGNVELRMCSIFPAGKIQR